MTALFYGQILRLDKIFKYILLERKNRGKYRNANYANANCAAIPFESGCVIHDINVQLSAK